MDLCRPTFHLILRK
uniref:Uncharacterized protein n=1 Tax=Anguilla anguilla TaxID=7936 RepID=A0A0E9X9N1_ANGAN